MKATKVEEYRTTFKLTDAEVEQLYDLWAEDEEIFEDSGTFCIVVCPECGSELNGCEQCQTCGWGITHFGGSVNLAEAYAEF